MTKEVTFWFMIVVVVGCKSTGSVAGYYYSDATSLNNHTLFLKENGSFRYDLSGELLDAESSGSWRLSGLKELILTSNDSLRSGIVHSVERTDGFEGSFSIKLTDARGEPLPHATVSVDEKQKGFNVNDAGYGTYQIEGLKSLTIHYLGEQYQYILENANTNELALAIKIHSEETLFFNNEAWRIKGRKLIGKNGLILTKNKRDEG